MGNTERIRVLSLCAGYDGIALGLAKVLDRPLDVVAVEIEAYAQAVLCNNANKEARVVTKAVWSDIKSFPSARFRGCFDIITCGIPCQPWSCAGKQQGTADVRWIWEDVFRIITEIQPEYVFLEEVPGFVRGGGLGFVLSDFTQIGFNAEWDCFTAAEVGAPHKRERLFILAYSEQQRLRGWGDGIPARLCGQVQIERPSELGDANHDGLFTGQKRASIEERNGSEQAGAFSTSKFERPDIERKELGYAEDLRLQEQCKAGREQMEFDGTDEELADTGNEGLQGLRECDKPQGRQAQTGHTGSSSEIRQSRYPARPGQPQYEWEEPRTLEPAVGRADDEHTTELDECLQMNTWVDEIRMCGNGVVPDCAALAWTTLWNRINNEQTTQGSLFQ